MSEVREWVFVYGTLRSGGSNHWRMEGAELVASGSVGGRIYRIDWYPGVVLGNEGRVIGEVYAVGMAQLAELDAFEGVSGAEVDGREYRRVKTLAEVDGEGMQVWIWEWIGPVDEGAVMVSGDWLSGEVG